MNAAEQLDRALRELSLNPAYDVRIGTLKQLVEYWHGPMGAADGYTSDELAGMQLPKALHWWYSWAGKRQEITSGDGRFIGPEIDNPPDEFGRIYCWNENQGVFHRAVSAEGDDPPVFQSDWNGGRDDEWSQEGMSLLELLMQLCVYEARSESWGFLDIEAPLMKLFAAHIPRLPVPPWFTPDPDYTFALDFHVGQGIFAVVHDLACSAAGVRGFTLHVCAKSPVELRILDQLLLGETWDQRTF